MTKLQKNIYQEGKRIMVRIMCYHDTHKKQVAIPVKTVNDGVEILQKIREHNNDLIYANGIKKEQRVKLGYPELEKGKGEDRNLIKQNKNWNIIKEIKGKRYVWKCKTKEEAIQLRNELEKNNWNSDADLVGDAKHGSKRNTYKRFEEVKNFPRLHIPRKERVLPEKTATRKQQETTENEQLSLLQNKATEYNISLDEMKNLTMMIGLQQIQRLNFIPEWEDNDVYSNI